MNKTLHEFFTKDHHLIESYLNKATENSEIDLEYYHLFRTRLLRHIKMEEKVLFPAAKEMNPTVMQALIPQYRLEHGALTALVVPPPTAEIIRIIRHLLNIHDIKEEEKDGMYDICEALTNGQTEALLAQLEKTEEVPVLPFNPAPIAIDSARRALIRAGYDYDELSKE